MVVELHHENSLLLESDVGTLLYHAEAKRAHIWTKVTTFCIHKVKPQLGVPATSQLMNPSTLQS